MKLAAIGVLCEDGCSNLRARVDRSVDGAVPRRLPSLRGDTCLSGTARLITLPSGVPHPELKARLHLPRILPVRRLSFLTFLSIIYPTNVCLCLPQDCMYSSHRPVVLLIQF